VQALVVAPTQKHLEEIQGLIEERLSEADAEELLHPDPRLASVSRPQRENWFLYRGAAGCIRYLVGSRPDQIRGSKVALLWLDEAGFLDDAVWSACKPMVWEHRARTLLTGTPAFDETHFFTRQAVAGLPASHERADQKIAKPDSRVKTFLASSEHAYSEVAREEVARDIASSGADSLYVLQEVRADWRMPGFFVFEWHAPTHVATVTRRYGAWVLETSRGDIELDDRPRLLGGLDWFRGAAPGGALALAFWPEHPLNPGDPRGLALAFWERTTGRNEGEDDFIRAVKEAQQKLDVEGWYPDPTSEEKIRLAKKAGVVMRETNNRDKVGRVGLVQRLVHHTKEIAPALYVSRECKVFARQLAGYKRARDRKGQPTEKFIDYDDCLIDAAAYVVPKLASTTVAGGGWG
jgi:hypothetical protein